MIREKLPTQNAIERARRLIAVLIDDSTPSALKRKIQEWFVSMASTDAKYEALFPMFNSLKPNMEPDQYEYERFGDILQRIALRDKENRDRYYKKKEERVLLRRLFIRIAAVMIPVMLIIGGTILWIERAEDTAELPPVTTMAVSTTDYDQKHLILPDGSEVWLNKSSQITYPEDFMKNRNIEMTGEAYFFIKKIDNSIFTVKTEGLTAKVLGTKFNVRAYGDESETQIVLDDGSISVYAGKKEYVMKPDERLVITRQNYQVQLDKDTDGKVLWRKGMEFYDNQLEYILTSSAAYFNLDIEIIGNLANDRIKFGFDYDTSPELVFSVLKNLQQNFSYKISGNKVIIAAN